MTTIGSAPTKELLGVVKQLYNDKYPDAEVVFFAGSLFKTAGTRTSDIDVVVAYASLPNAYRESYYYQGYPVEAFVHSPQTLEYFFDSVDRPTGVPVLATMVAEGLELPAPSSLSQKLKRLAQRSLQRGPIPWSQQELDISRYTISELVEDIRHPRQRNELYAVATQLYGLIGNHYCRSRQIWSAKGKYLPNWLHKVDPSFANRFDNAFHSAFAFGRTDEVANLAAEVLSPHGGSLFEGHLLKAPKGWRTSSPTP